MSTARLSRESKRQLGQFLTPPETAAAIVAQLELTPDMRILEPSFGNGVFIFAILERLKENSTPQQLSNFISRNLAGCELDGAIFQDFQRQWRRRKLPPCPRTLCQQDFFRYFPAGSKVQPLCSSAEYRKKLKPSFDLIIGNPPFGGSFAPELQDWLDDIYGVRNREKIKKESYAFFIVKSMDLLKKNGKLVFICSDSILSINTMSGLRRHLMGCGSIKIQRLPQTFQDTTQKMILLTVTKDGKNSALPEIFGRQLSRGAIDVTPNASWLASADFTPYFQGELLGEKMVASSGMTTGNNQLFLRKIQPDGTILEPYDFSITQVPVTLEEEVARARLGYLGPRQRQRILEQERAGETHPAVRWQLLPEPRRIQLPHPDYKWYNKAIHKDLYSPPDYVIFWRNNGEYVYTYKKFGNWYLHGVGGRAFFGREGLSWSLIATRFYLRYLPEGYILDSGAPCAFLKPGVPREEMFFILAWGLTKLCNRIQKSVINHTRNIQSKDFERLPYPFWVSPENKAAAIQIIKEALALAQLNPDFSPNLDALEELFLMPGAPSSTTS